MADEVPTADWATLFKEIPVAVEQLRSHEAHCAPEAAALIECAMDVLHAFDPVRAYDRIAHTMCELAHLSLHHRHLPADTTRFMSILSDDYIEVFSPRGEQDVIERLSAPRS
ncbi:MAG: hypothetical protein V2J51_07845 [Erythrobacter sp.]|jgi:hypothetical protein|nr:hypothetical protein [Erythrobacter sp.]